MIKVLLIIFFGTGQSQTFDSVPFNNMDECQVAKTAIAKHFAGKWHGPGENHMDCVEIGPK